jgi:hypothetical protein
VDRQEELLTGLRPKTGPSSWCHHPVRYVLGSATATAMDRRARAWSAENGGRFQLLPDRILLWSRRPRRLAAAIHFRRLGSGGGAIVYALSWNPTAGSSADEVLTALDLLTQGTAATLD